MTLFEPALRKQMRFLLGDSRLSAMECAFLLVLLFVVVLNVITILG
jgi:hypothetical protein